MKQASLQTNIEAGDGTTTATVLARSIINEGQRTLLLEYHLLNSKGYG